MSTRKERLSRVTITVPADLIRKADRLADSLGRSRSWVISEALRVYLDAQEKAPTAVRETALAPYQSGLGEQRLAQLESDLRLTPAQRVHASEESAELARRFRRAPRVRQVVLFDALEDYFAWDKRERLP